MTPLERLGEVSREYQRMAIEFESVAIAAARAEADHKWARARAILSARETSKSHAEAETRADADDAVAGLYRDRLLTAAVADAHRERLRQLREQVANGRTAVASERESDRIHATGGNT